MTQHQALDVGRRRTNRESASFPGYDFASLWTRSQAKELAMEVEAQPLREFVALIQMFSALPFSLRQTIRALLML